MPRPSLEQRAGRRPGIDLLHHRRLGRSLTPGDGMIDPAARSAAASRDEAA